MINYVVTYLTGGIVLNLVGPIASDIRNEMRSLRMSPAELRFDVRRRLLLAEIMLRSILLCLYPFAYTMWFIERHHRLKGVPSEADRKRHQKVRLEIQKERRKKDLLEGRTFVYFKDTSGDGIIQCHGCGFRQEIVSYAREIDYKHPFTGGYQCQKCGEIRMIHFPGGRLLTPFLRCACGGELSNVKPIFCPRCKARDVHYILEYVT